MFTARSPLICVVDDHESVREALLGLLRSVGLRVVTFEHAEALRDARELADAACLIVDVQLPGMSGLELLRELRSHGVVVPAIVITGRLDATTSARAVDAGAHALLSKPFEDELLLSALRTALGSAGMDRALPSANPSPKQAHEERAEMRDQTFVSNVDGTKIFVHAWRPPGPARAVLIISHGFKAHGGLYARAGEHFARSGIAVYAIDHRGHGNSGGDRYEATHVDEFVRDLDQLVELAKGRDPGLPLFLLGHSAGGVMGCVYALEHQDKLAGFLCESFALGVYAPGFALSALKGLSHVAPHLHVLELKNELFSRDPEVVAELDRDPLIPELRYPTQTVAAMVRATERVRAEFARITLPVLILHGSEDKVTEPAGSQLFFESTGSQDKTLKLYEGHFHDLLADLGREGVLADMLSWLEARLGTVASAQA